MGRLIDADALIELIQSHDDITLDRFSELSVIRVIKEQSTAYSVEDVIDELEYLKIKHEEDMRYWAEHDWKDNASYGECHLSNGQAVCFEQAIDIVRKGGVE